MGIYPEYPDCMPVFMLCMFPYKQQPIYFNVHQISSQLCEIFHSFKSQATKTIDSILTRTTSHEDTPRIWRLDYSICVVYISLRTYLKMNIYYNVFSLNLFLKKTTRIMMFHTRNALGRYTLQFVRNDRQATDAFTDKYLWMYTKICGCYEW